jgi:hypothetical protein
MFMQFRNRTRTPRNMVGKGLSSRDIFSLLSIVAFMVVLLVALFRHRVAVREETREKFGECLESRHEGFGPVRRLICSKWEKENLEAK